MAMCACAFRTRMEDCPTTKAAWKCSGARACRPGLIPIIRCSPPRSPLQTIYCSATTPQRLISLGFTVWWSGEFRPNTPAPSRYAWLLAPFNLFELSDSNSVMVSVHGLLGADKAVDIQDPARSERQPHLNTQLQHGIETSKTQYLTHAVQRAQIGLQVQVS